jgi:hypothetical protein
VEPVNPVEKEGWFHENPSFLRSARIPCNDKDFTAHPHIRHPAGLAHSPTAMNGELNADDIKLRAEMAKLKASHSNNRMVCCPPGHLLAFVLLKSPHTIPSRINSLPSNLFFVHFAIPNPLHLPPTSFHPPFYTPPSVPRPCLHSCSCPHSF